MMFHRSAAKLKVVPVAFGVSAAYTDRSLIVGVGCGDSGMAARHSEQFQLRVRELRKTGTQKM